MITFLTATAILCGTAAVIGVCAAVIGVPISDLGENVRLLALMSLIAAIVLIGYLMVKEG